MTRCTRCAALLCVLWALSVPARAQQTAEATAEAHMKAGRHAEALAALAGVRARPGSEQAARADLLRATALRALARLPEAASAAGRARRGGETSGRPDIAARAYLQLAQISSDRGEDAAAALHLASALSAARASKQPTLQINVLEALGRNARARGDNQGALAYQRDAIKAAEDAGDLDLVVRARGARSATLLGLGRFDEALADAQTAYDRAAGNAPARLKASAAFALAQVQAHLWNLDRAVVLWGEALEHYKAAGLQIGVALATRQRMDTWFALGEFDRASADGAEALRLMERTGSAGSTPDVFARLALIEARRGNGAAARGFAARAVSLNQEGPRRRFVENDLGLTSLFLGDLEDAAARFTRVLDQSVALGDLEYVWRAQHMRGRAQLQMGHVDQAERDLRNAVSTLERMRRTLPDAGLRASFMADRRDVHATLAEALMRRSRSSDDAYALEALEIAEQSRARSLVEQLAEADLRASDPRLDQIRSEERAFSTRLTGLQQQMLALPPDARGPAAAALASAEADYDALVIRLRRDHGVYRTVVNPAPLTHQALRAIPLAGEAVASYLFTFDGGIAWVARDGRLATFRIPARARIESQLRLLNALVQSGDLEGVRAIGASLYESLFGPARPMLEGAARLTVIPDGPLHRLPFALLRASRDRGGWLAESMPIALAPSGTVLARLRGRYREAAPGALAAFATEPSTRANLAHANREVTEVARLVSDAGPISVDARAGEAGVKGMAANRYRILHFATHAEVDETSPRRSAIVLGSSPGEDGLLQLNEIAALDLNARLVVAATCRSQLGRSVGGEGLMSLSRAFLQAGADAVVAALWDVDDAETRRFMGFFYAGLRGGLAPDQALRLAQNTMVRAGGASAAPQNWAGFVITGAATHAVFAAPPASALWLPVLGGVAAAGLLLLFVLRRRDAYRTVNRPAGEVAFASGRSTNQR